MAIEPVPPAPEPQQPLTDQDRTVALHKIQEALVEDDVRFGDLDDLYEQVYAAQTHGELAAVTAHLPVRNAPAPAVPAHPIARTGYAMFGDVKVGGWIAVESDLTYGSGFGDVVLDLSSAEFTTDTTVRVRSVFGDTTVILPDGVRASLQSASGFGRKAVSSLSPPVSGAPHVRVVSATLFGDSKLYSLSMVPQGRIRRMWRNLRNR